jgi:tight adherence protein B
MKLFMQLPDALDSITRAIRIGVSMPEALKNVGRDSIEPTATEFRKMSESIAIGISPAHAIQQMARDNKLAEYKFMAIAISLQASSGGSIGNTLENVSGVIRSRVNIKNRGKALTGEARASAAILTALPPITVGAMLVLSPSYADQLFLTAGGRHYLGVAIFMLSCGQYIMRNMVQKTLDSIK